MKKQLGGQLMLTITEMLDFDTEITLTKDNCDHLESLDSYIINNSNSWFSFNDKIIQKPICISFTNENDEKFITKIIKRSDDGLDVYTERLDNLLSTLRLEVVSDYDDEDALIGYHISVRIVSDGITDKVKEIIEDNSSDILTSLTHSFNELDDTLKAIVESAIESGEPIECTQAQWDVIKSLLDKSLYLNYDDTSLIKCLTNGIDKYIFGGISILGSQLDIGTSIKITYNSDAHEITVEFGEL